MQGNVSEEFRELGRFCLREGNKLPESKVTLSVAMEIKWAFSLCLLEQHSSKSALFYFIFFLIILSEAFCFNLLFFFRF